MTQAKVKVVKKKKKKQRQRAGKSQPSAGARASVIKIKKTNKQTTKNLFRNPLQGAGAAFRLVSAKVRAGASAPIRW